MTQTAISGSPESPAVRWLVQPQMALVAVSAALCSFATAYFVGRGSGFALSAEQIVLGLSLMATVIAAYQFPIYIRHNTKICVQSVPIYLLAVLLPPAAAGAGVALAVLIAEISCMQRRGTAPVDVATMTGRWATNVVLASAVAHVALGLSGPMLSNLPAIAAGVFMWGFDLATLPVALVPIARERPTRVWLSALREGGAAEAAQYVLGLVGVLLAQHQPWAIAMLLIPTGIVHLAFKKEMDRDTRQLLENMADTVDLRGSYTAGHSRRVRDLVGGILTELNMSGQEAAQILIAARLHDIGKIGLPDDLLINPGALTPEQQAVMESYPERGARMMEAYPDFSRGLEMVLHHHERWDGTGYPSRLSGTDIPFGARIIAVADSFDAMTSERPYRRPLTIDQAAQILLNGAGRQWDPDIVRAFLRSIGHHEEQRVAGRAPATEDLLTPAARRVLA